MLLAETNEIIDTNDIIIDVFDDIQAIPDNTEHVKEHLPLSKNLSEFEELKSGEHSPESFKPEHHVKPDEMQKEIQKFNQQMD